MGWLRKFAAVWAFMIGRPDRYGRVGHTQTGGPQAARAFG